MKAVGRMVVSVLCCAALSGCAIVLILSLEPEQRAALFMVPPDRGVIYVYTGDEPEVAVLADISLDGESLGPRNSAGFWYRDVAPGPHTVSLGAKAEKLTLTVEVGHAYFVDAEPDCAPDLHMTLHEDTQSDGHTRIWQLYAASKSEPASQKTQKLACADAPSGARL